MLSVNINVIIKDKIYLKLIVLEAPSFQGKKLLKSKKCHNNTIQIIITETLNV
jgi:hypothetical protein